MSFEVFVMIVMAIEAIAIFMLYRMMGNDQKHYISAFNNINSALNDCMDAIDCYGDIVDGILTPLKEKLDADSTHQIIMNETPMEEYKENETEPSFGFGGSFCWDFRSFSVGEVVYGIACSDAGKWAEAADGFPLRIDNINKDEYVYSCTILDGNEIDAPKTISVHGKRRVFGTRAESTTAVWTLNRDIPYSDDELDEDCY